MKRIVVLAMLAGAAGCFSLHQTEFPETEISRLTGRDLAVQLADFEAQETVYRSVYNYSSSIGSTWGLCWRRHPHSGLMTSSTVSETVIPETKATARYLDQATELLEEAGFTLRAPTPDYQVVVHFTGPIQTMTDKTVAAAWYLLSVLSADYLGTEWQAKLKIYNAKTGKLLFSQLYRQRYQAAIWGPLPIFSPSGADIVVADYAQCWCLNALTRRTMADASAFLLAQPK